MKKVVTIILDGFGMKEDPYGNAVKNAGMNNFIELWNKYPHCLLKSSGVELGLEEKQVGFSEIGHKILGSGYKVKNRLTETNSILSSNKLKYNPKFSEILFKLKDEKINLHLTILLSDGGISSHLNHLISFIKILRDNKVKNKIFIHAISDGRDSQRYSVYDYIEKIATILDENTVLASVCGRYYALDDTQDYKRTKYFYDLLFNGKAVDSPDILKVIKMCYAKNLSDEYLPPLKTKDFEKVKTNDVFIFLNLSTFNEQQILEAMENKNFLEFDTKDIKINIYSLYEIRKDLNKNYMLETPSNKNTLCEYLSKLDITQARIYETIKKNSMKYYLDGERDIAIGDCDYLEVESPVVDSFDSKPEMSSLALSKQVIKSMEKDTDFIIVNFPNPDSVGHTGNFQATINSLQAIDVCLGKIIDAANENFYKIIIVGSHAKADTIINRQNEIVTKNTLSPVPFIIMDEKVKLYNGDMTMVAPTILKYLDIAIPKEMKETKTLMDKK